MMKFLRHLAEMTCPWGRVLVITFAILFLWTAKGMTLTPPKGTPVINTATAQYFDSNGGGDLFGNPLIANSNKVSLILDSAPRLHIIKNADSDPVSAGAILNYTLTYENTGNDAATGVMIVDTLPGNVTFQSASSGGIYNSANRTVTWTVGTVASGIKEILKVTVQTHAGLAPGTRISNHASITSAEHTADTATITTKIGSAPNVVIIDSASVTATTPGGWIDYTIHYSNKGNAPATNVFLHNDLPLQTALVAGSITGAGHILNRTITWSLGSLQPGDSGSVNFRVQVSPLAASGDVITNISTITSSETAVLNSNQLFTPVVAATRTPGEVAFFDTAWQPAYGYLSSDIVYLQVKDLDQNIDRASVETVKVVLTNPATGDTETIILTETGNDTGIFRGNMPITLTATAKGDGTLTVAANSRIQATYTDILDTAPVSNASALIDPLGIVFNSITGNPVPGAIVTLRNWNASANTCDLTSWPTLPAGQVNPALPTGTDGKFAFPLVPPGDYCFQTTPPTDYTFPSGIADADLPAGFTITPASRGGKFTLNVGDPPLISDIPVDPSAGRLTITKTANKTTAVIGDLIIYSLSLTNNGQSPVTGVAIADVMPHGIAYIKGSTQLEGVAYTEPQAAGGLRTLTWQTGSLAPNKSLTLYYRAVVGPDTQTGDAINTASASGKSLGKGILSNNASFKIKITEGVFTNKGTIIGRVFIDQNGDGLPNQDPGVSEAVLYLEDGTRIITDKNGKFSITGIEPGTHVLRLDETSLPRGLMPKPISNRFMTTGTSQFIDMKTSGLFKANFALDKTKDYQEPDQAQAKPEKGKESLPAVPVTSPTTIPGPTGTTEEKTIPTALTHTGIYPAVQDTNTAHVPSAPPANLDTTETQVKGKTASAPAQESQVPEMVRPEKSREETAPAQQGKTIPEIQQTSEKTSEVPLEKQILTMTPELAFLKPQDQAVITRNSTRVLVKCPTDAVLTLTANGNTVENRQIGKQIKNEQRRVVIYEFIDVQLNAGGENIIKAEIRDAFGIVRGDKQIRLQTVGDPARIAILPDRKAAVADGKSLIKVEVSLLDHNGHLIPYDAPVTVSTTAGEIQEKDVDGIMDGHQIPCRNGTANFTILAPRDTGEAKINVQVNDLTQSEDIYFVPYLRPMFMVGVGEIVLGHGRSSGNISYLKDRSFFGDGTYLDGRGAFFIKGQVFKDVLLTAAYDSNKKKSDELFRESDARVDSEDKYPAYGDESKTGYEALSRENLYVKLEKGKSFLLYGDYRTDLTETSLSTYTRSFNGLKGDIHTDKLRLRSFATHTNQSRFIDTLPGKGISGFYYLNSKVIIEGSERVVIETRDRLQPDRILNRDVKSRGSDYDIDYGMGTLLFKAAVPSHDADGNPLYIVVTYEGIAEGSKKYFIYGGHGSYKLHERLEAGATGIVEENAISNSYILGTDITLKLPFKTIVKAEYANTYGLFDTGNMLEAKNGDGWSVDLKSQPMAKLALNGYYKTLSDYFSNISATDAVRGTRKWGLDATYEVMPGLMAKAKYLDEEDRINHTSHRLASISANKKFTKTVINAELAYETSENLTPMPAQTPFTPGGLLNGVPFLNTYETPEKATFLKLGIERELLKDLALSLSHKQDVGGNNYFMSQGGLTYKIDENHRLYIREEYAKYQNGTQTRTLIGAESQVTKSTTAYQEYRLADGSAGYRNQQVMGLKNKFQIMDKLTANIAGEYLSTLSGQKNANEPDAFAVATGMEYLPHDNLKVTGRAEHRHEIVENGKDSYLAEAALAFKLHPDYTLLMRERYFQEGSGNNGQDATSRLMMGLAYRPIENDKFNALCKMEYKYDKRLSSKPTYSIDSFIFSSEGNYQFNPKLQLTGKYAGKLEKDDAFSSYTDLIAARFLYDLTDRFDFGAEYRLISSHLTGSRSQGGSIETGYRVFDQLWISLGYSFDRFDEDLVGDSYQGDGPYLKLRFKLDENSLKRFRK